MARPGGGAPPVAPLERHPSRARECRLQGGTCAARSSAASPPEASVAALATPRAGPSAASSTGSLFARAGDLERAREAVRHRRSGRRGEGE
eukprot:2994342-Alexandrium_andersonii.AAC.1